MRLEQWSICTVVYRYRQQCYSTIVHCHVRSYWIPCLKHLYSLVTSSMCNDIRNKNNKVRIWVLESFAAALIPSSVNLLSQRLCVMREHATVKHTASPIIVITVTIQVIWCYVKGKCTSNSLQWFEMFGCSYELTDGTNTIVSDWILLWAEEVTGKPWMRKSWPYILQCSN